MRHLEKSEIAAVSGGCEGDTICEYPDSYFEPTTGTALAIFIADWEQGVTSGDSDGGGESL